LEWKETLGIRNKESYERRVMEKSSKLGRVRETLEVELQSYMSDKRSLSKQMVQVLDVSDQR
jgi:hypothetical protein